MRLPIAVTMICVFLFTSAAFGAGLKDGLAAYDKSDFVNAMKILRPLAEKGDTEAQFWVGDMYFEGLGGITKDNDSTFAVGFSATTG